jgi:LemA protein
MLVTENYPSLKADASFLNLQTQLEGTENRITVARGRYIQLVQDYNTYIRQFPVNLTAMVFGHKTKPNFTVENEAQIQQAPNVDFVAAAKPEQAVPQVEPATPVMNPPQPALPPVQGSNAPQPAPTE